TARGERTRRPLEDGVEALPSRAGVARPTHHALRCDSGPRSFGRPAPAVRAAWLFALEDRDVCGRVLLEELGHPPTGAGHDLLARPRRQKEPLQPRCRVLRVAQADPERAGRLAEFAVVREVRT